MAAVLPVPGRRQSWWALAVCALLALLWAWGFQDPRSWGWDESMHAELPAARLVLATEALRPAAAMAAVHDADRYPIVFPALLAVPQLLLGIDEDVARRSAVVVWCAALFALFLLARELARAVRGPAEEPRWWESRVPWIALTLGALSPMGLAYGSSLFLETPSVLFGALALRGWLRRGAHLGESGRFARERRAGGWFVLCFFTKFNYCLLLAAGCGVDWLLEGIAETAKGRGHLFLRRTAHLLTLPALFGAWWFLLPLPHGLETAAEHREAFVEFLIGNVAGNGQDVELRTIFLTCFLAITLRMFALQLVGLLASLPAGVRGARVLWLTLTATFLPIWLHPFFLDRFWLPLGVSLWPLAALGLARISPRRPTLAAGSAALLLALVLVRPTADVTWLADRFGLLQHEEPLASFQREEFARLSDLSRDRIVPSRPALMRDERETLDRLIAAGVGPMERVGWLGVSSEYSPAALHLGLLANGGAPARFLRDAHQPLDLEFRGNRGYGEWSDAELVEWASGFDVLLMSDPPDFHQREGRAYMRPLQQRLTEELDWRVEVLGKVERSRTLRDPLSIRIFAARPPR